MNIDTTRFDYMPTEGPVPGQLAAVLLSPSRRVNYADQDQGFDFFRAAKTAGHDIEVEATYLVSATKLRGFAASWPAKSTRSVLEAKVSALAQLDEGWDGYRGKAPSPDAIRDAIAFIRLLPILSFAPSVSPGSSGAFSLFWKSENGVADAEFDGTGEVAIYYADAGRQILLSGAFPIPSKELPAEILAGLRRLIG